MIGMDTETKGQRFKRLASARTNEVLYKLKVLGNCSNRQSYDYTEEEINAIFLAIDRKVREVKSKFHFDKVEKFKL